MPIIQRPYVPPEDQVPQEDEYVNPGDTQESGSTGEPITFYADSMHVIAVCIQRYCSLENKWKSGNRYCALVLK